MWPIYASICADFSKELTGKKHVTYQTLHSLTFIYVRLTMTTRKSRHALAAVAINHILTAATILTDWTRGDF